MIRQAAIADAKAISDIYNHYVLNATATFEEESVTGEEMERRIVEVTATHPWYIYETDGEVQGFAYATRWKPRSAYRYSAETTIYVRHSSLDRGLGTALYTRLLDDLRQQRMHAAIACIALPNERSQRLHEKMGYRKTAHFPEVGYKFGSWVDLGYWELLFDTESPRAF